MRLHTTTTALLLVALSLPLAATAQDPYGQDPYGQAPYGQAPYGQAPQQVYPAEPIGPEVGDYGVTVDLEAGPPVSFTTFQQPLAAYGDWVTVGTYGTVWRPWVPAGWRPYLYGRWEWTTEGWLWVSDEPFGWATFHYGRWTFDRGLGWLWVPGYQWAPAWVNWRYSGDVVGWAPLAPGFSLYVTSYAFVDFWWTFVPTVSFCGVPVHGVAYAPSYARHWYGATRPAPPSPGYHGGSRPPPGRLAPPAWGGPSPRLVEERAGRPLSPVRIVPAAAPGHDRARPGEIGVYRPEARPYPGSGGRGPGAASPPGRGGGLNDGSPRGGGRGTAPVPAPGYGQRGGGRASPSERAHAYQAPPGPTHVAPAAPAAPFAGSGGDRGRGGGTGVGSVGGSRGGGGSSGGRGGDRHR
jgi:hypothetical protein